MKTSNKLLMLLLVLLFLIPLMTVMGFKAAIKNNQYVVRNTYGHNVSDFKDLRPFKVIRMDGGSQDKQLKCNIRYGDKYGYKFNNYDPQQLEEGRSDSCNINIAGDTLVISYGTRANEALKANNYFYGVEVEITIPETMTIVANAAMVNMDSSAARFSYLNFLLTRNTLLSIVSNTHSRGAENSNIDKTVFPKIVIDATSSQIDLNENSAVKNLQVSLKEQSRLNVNEKAGVDTLSGSISDESVINAPYSLVKKFKQ
ncbi:MAG: hypothetical protein QM594_10485 [Niabella sp.]